MPAAIATTIPASAPPAPSAAPAPTATPAAIPVTAIPTAAPAASNNKEDLLVPISKPCLVSCQHYIIYFVK